MSSQREASGVDGPFDLSSTFVHLGLNATATPLPDFQWTPEYLASYEERFAADGGEGRIVVMNRQDETWPQWERHPAGEEVVVLLSGRVDLIQEIDGEERTVELAPGQAVVNPPNTWHTANVHEPGEALFITPGKGTEHRPR
jgi:quercetin dioxygenase-like cupin family protein